MKELRMLSSLHGIGLMRLYRADLQNDGVDGEILIPARERSDVDWDTANRLCQENPDFAEVVKLVRQFYQTGELREKDWD